MRLCFNLGFDILIFLSLRDSIGRHPASCRMTVESQSGRHHLILGDKLHRVSLISTESEKVALFTFFFVVFICLFQN